MLENFDCGSKDGTVLLVSVDGDDVSIKAGIPSQWRLTSPRDRTPPPRLFPTLAAAQADAVQWLRATIAEMAAMLPEVE